MRLDRGRYQEEVIIGGHRQPASRAGQYLHRFRPPQAADPVETVRLLAGFELIAFAAGALRGQEANRPDTVCHQAEIPHQLRKALPRDPQVGLGIGSAIHSLRHSQVQLAYFRRVAVFPLAEMLVDTDEPRLRTPVRAFPFTEKPLVGKPSSISVVTILSTGRMPKTVFVCLATACMRKACSTGTPTPAHRTGPVEPVPAYPQGAVAVRAVPLR